MSTADFHTGHPDPRLLELPGSPPAYDPVAKTLFGVPIQLLDMDVAALSHHSVLAVFVSAMHVVENSKDEVDGFAQVGDQVLVCPKDGGNTGVVHLCWRCMWPKKAHSPECPWKAVLDVNAL